MKNEMSGWVVFFVILLLAAALPVIIVTNDVRRRREEAQEWRYLECAETSDPALCEALIDAVDARCGVCAQEHMR